MKRLLLHFMGAAALCSAVLFSSCSKEEDDSLKNSNEAVEIVKKNNTAILLCSFGSTYEQPQLTYDSILADYQRAFPNADIYMSFTSGTIVSRVYAKIGKAYAQPDVWMSALGKAGYDSVFVQSLHIIPGEEYLGLVKTITKKYLMTAYPNIEVATGGCLLYADDDVSQVAQVLYSYYKARLDAGQVVAFMGHGNPDTEYVQANEKYTKLEKALQALSGKANIFVGTVDWGEQKFSHVREGIIRFAKDNNKNYSDVIVSLTPLMSIAGDHAQNDLLGGLESGKTMADVNPYEDDEDPQFSWILKLKKLGFQMNAQGTTTTTSGFNVIGLGDHKSIRAIWVEHMLEARKSAISWNQHLGVTK
ncbi:MAG: sirohydrochlorin cobaltochelatase [Dysgonamonadaceae bacterium]